MRFLAIIPLALFVVVTSALVWVLGLVSTPYGDLDGWDWWK
jgi:hypothetical protein